VPRIRLRAAAPTIACVATHGCRRPDERILQAKACLQTWRMVCSNQCLELASVNTKAARMTAWCRSSTHLGDGQAVGLC